MNLTIKALRANVRIVIRDNTGRTILDTLEHVDTPEEINGQTDLTADEQFWPCAVEELLGNLRELPRRTIDEMLRVPSSARFVEKVPIITLGDHTAEADRYVREYPDGVKEFLCIAGIAIASKRTVKAYTFTARVVDLVLQFRHGLGDTVDPP